MYGGDGAFSIDRSPVGPSHDAASQVSATAVTSPINHNGHDLLPRNHHLIQYTSTKAISPVPVCTTEESDICARNLVVMCNKQVTSTKQKQQLAIKLLLAFSIFSLLLLMNLFNPFMI
ncbi:hypothetical protein Tco_1291309, partial [Tanacetum coccineum]